jgi:PAS domain S-box-containing protein
MRINFALRSLPAQMILSFSVVIILTAVTVGIPAIWLIRNQLDRQAWSQVANGQQAALALYAAKQGEVENFAHLTAQRPTLLELLSEGKGTEIEDYLHTIQTSAGLDFIVVCGPQEISIASTNKEVSDHVCSGLETDAFYINSMTSTPRVWLISASVIERLDGDKNKVIVGIEINDQFARQMHSETGLEHTVFVNEQTVATSYTSTDANLNTAFQNKVHQERSTHWIYKLNGKSYYAAMFPLNGLNLGVNVALDVSGIAATQNRLVWIMVGSILAVSAAGSVLGVFLARRISQPLVRLSEAAGNFSKGDLSTSVSVEAQVREVTQVAQALESARVDLLQTLTNLQQEKAWINHLLESIVEGIVTLDPSGIITFFSHGAERITGWSRDQVLGQSCDTVFRLVEIDKPFSNLIPAPGGRNKITVELSAGRQSTLAITGARLAPSEAGEEEIALVFRDVSEEEAVHRLLGQFLANIAHEFRTPLSALAASIELLLDQAPDLSQAELKELLNSLHLGTLGLQTLVDNLLESASIEAGRFRVSPRASDLGLILAEATQTMQPLLEKYGQHLIVELPPEIPIVWADPRRTVQVLVNLLSNASKYGPTEETITIRVRVKDQLVRVEVADRGTGIPPQHRENLFRRFVYPDSHTGSAMVGAGLGLSVVKAIIEAHDGGVGVDDRPGGGAIFWFTLPIASDI